MNKTLRERLIAAIDDELCQRSIFENHTEVDGTWDSYKVSEFIFKRIEKELLLHLVDENKGYFVVQEKE